MSSKSATGDAVDVGEYVCIDLKRVPATHIFAIKRDRRVRALIDATNRIGLFVPTHIAQLLCDFGPYHIRWSRIAAGRGFSVAIMEDGSLVSWGYDGHGRVMICSTEVFTMRARSANFIGKILNSVNVRYSNIRFQVPNKSEFQVSGTPTNTGFVSVSAGLNHSVALKEDGSLIAWGGDSHGQVSGAPTTADLVAVAAGEWHSLALKEDGSLISWGYNAKNQVSDTPTTSDFVAVFEGSGHCVGLKDDGSLISWGSDRYGQVSDTPTDTGFVAVSAALHNVALKEDGSLISWGSDRQHQVSDTPTTSAFVAVSAGLGHSMALKADGSLISWGESDRYGLVSNSPTAGVFVAIAAGTRHSVAMKEDGSLISWGDDSNGVVSNTPSLVE